MENKSKNKAEGKPAANKSEAPASDLKEARGGVIAQMTAEVSEMSDDKVLEGIAVTQDALGILQIEAAKRGITGFVAGDRRPIAEAGKIDGNFVCNRGMEGDRSYSKGDARSGKVSDLAHLAKSGAISPADDETAKAVSDFLGRDVAVYSAPAATEAEA